MRNDDAVVAKTYIAVPVNMLSSIMPLFKFASERANVNVGVGEQVS